MSMMIHVTYEIFRLFFAFAVVYLPLTYVALRIYEERSISKSLSVLDKLSFDQIPDVSINTNRAVGDFIDLQH